MGHDRHDWFTEISLLVTILGKRTVAEFISFVIKFVNVIILFTRKIRMHGDYQSVHFW